MGGQLDPELTECAATPFATINGTGSRIFCRDVRVTSELRPRTPGCLWKRFSIVIAPACLGATCRNVLATRSRFTRDFRAGRRVAYGRRHGAAQPANHGRSTASCRGPASLLALSIGPV